MSVGTPAAEQAERIAGSEGGVNGAPSLAPYGPRPYARARARDWRSALDSWVTRLVIDAVMVAGAVAATTLVWNGSVDSEFSLAWLAGYSAIVLVALAASSSYRPRLRIRFLDHAPALIGAPAIGAMALVLVGALSGDGISIDAQLVGLWLLTAAFLAAGRAVLSFAQREARKHEEVRRPTLILGAGRVGWLTAERLFARQDLGLEPIGFVDDDPAFREWNPSGNGSSPIQLPVLGDSSELDQVLEAHSVEHVVVAFSAVPSEDLLKTVQHCEDLGVGVSLVPRLFEKFPERMTVEHLGGVPLLTLYPSNPGGWRLGLKYLFDRVLAALALIILLPLLIAVAIAVWISLGRPVLYRQARVGRNGETFQMLKFRSMKKGDEKPDIPEISDVTPTTAPGGVDGEDRRTRVGAFLRRSSIDELPQLINVLTGSMSLIGPRPERPEFVQVFDGRVYRYAERHRVKPGITGWAQINGLRGKTSLADRVEWDNYYIENWSFAFDAKIFALTVVEVARGRHAE